MAPRRFAIEQHRLGVGRHEKLVQEAALGGQEASMQNAVGSDLGGVARNEALQKAYAVVASNAQRGTGGKGGVEAGRHGGGSGGGRGGRVPTS